MGNVRDLGESPTGRIGRRGSAGALAAVPAARPERDEALDELRGRQAALALLDRDLGIDRGATPSWRKSSITSGTPARPVTNVGSIVSSISNSNRGDVSGIGLLLWRGCTHRVKPRNPDAIAGNRLHSGLPCNLLGCSSC